MTDWDLDAESQALAEALWSEAHAWRIKEKIREALARAFAAGAVADATVREIADDALLLIEDDALLLPR